MYCDTSNLESPLKHVFLSKYSCFDYGGDYVTNFYNFDNIIKSMMTLITITFTNDSWINILYKLKKNIFYKRYNFILRLSLSSIAKDKHNSKGIYEYDRE